MSESEETRAAIVSAIEELRQPGKTLYASMVANVAIDILGLDSIPPVGVYNVLENLKNVAGKILHRKSVMAYEGPKPQIDMFDDGLPEFANKPHKRGQEGGFVPLDDATRDDATWNMRRAYKTSKAYDRVGDAWRNFVAAKWGDLSDSDFMDRPDDDFYDDRDWEQPPLL